MTTSVAAAFLLSGWVWLAERQVGAWATGVVALVACGALAGHLALTLGSDADLWFWGRCNAIAEEHHQVVSFAPIFFAASKTCAQVSGLPILYLSNRSPR